MQSDPQWSRNLEQEDQGISYQVRGQCYNPNSSKKRGGDAQGDAPAELEDPEDSADSDDLDDDPGNGADSNPLPPSPGTKTMTVRDFINRISTFLEPSDMCFMQPVSGLWHSVIDAVKDRS